MSVYRTARFLPCGVRAYSRSIIRDLIAVLSRDKAFFGSRHLESNERTSCCGRTMRSSLACRRRLLKTSVKASQQGDCSTRSLIASNENKMSDR